jgi:hypothetical protein
VLLLFGHSSWPHLWDSISCKWDKNYHIYANARQGFFLKFGAYICEVTLNWHMNRWTGPCQMDCCEWTIWVQVTACITKLSCVNKRENGAWLNLTDTICFLLALSIIRFFKDAHWFEWSGWFHCETQKHLTWWTSQTKLFSITGPHRNRKMVIGKLKINYKPQTYTWTNLQIKNQWKSYEVRLIRPQTQHKNSEHMYLKFLTSLTPSVEKIVKFHGFN